VIKLTADYRKRLLARAVPGAYWNPTEKSWVVEDPTPRAAVVVLSLFPELRDKHPELIALRDEVLSDARPFDNATGYDRRITAPRCEAALRTDEHDWYEYQSIDLGYLADVLRMHGSAYVGWERGLGKTLGACALAENLDAQRILVVCPNTAKETVWAPEVERFLGKKVWVMPNGSPEKRKRVMDDVERSDECILVAHYEALNLIAKERSRNQGWDKYGEWDLVIADEAHRLSNPKTLMNRSIKRVPARYRLALSGSIIQNHPEEIFGVLTWLFPTQYARKWADWNDRYLDYVKSGYGKILVGPKPGRIEAMRKELGVFTVYRRKKDELDLPPKTEQSLYVDLSPKQRAAYDELRDSYVTTLDSGESVVAIQPVVMLTRLRQVASGLGLVSGEVTDSSKLDLAVELIRDDPDNPYVVFTWYKESANELGRRLRDLKEEVYVVTGDTKAPDRATYIKDFQAGSHRVFIGTISTLGESVNLHRAADAIRLDRSWNPAANEQAEDRLYRIGQDRPVTITDIVARDTVDDLRVLPRLADKDALRRAILGGK
jgi:SNF2 family DNA or RNA helicase